MNIDINTLSELLSIKQSRIISFVYINAKKEKSRYTILVGGKLENAYIKDLKKLKNMVFSNDIENIAKNELIDSINNSLINGIGHNSKYTKENQYSHTDNNIKEYDENIYLKGFILKKTIIETGTEKTVNSKPITIIKNKIKESLRMGKYREFKLSTDNLKSISLNGKRIEII